MGHSYHRISAMRWQIQRICLAQGSTMFSCEGIKICDRLQTPPKSTQINPMDQVPYDLPSFSFNSNRV